MNTDTTTDRIIAVDHGMSLEAMIAAGKYDWVNDNITPDKFPVDGRGIKKFRTKLFDFGRILSEDAVAAMRAKNFMPAGHVHGLAFGATFPDEQRKYPIACLASSAQVRGPRFVLCLNRNGAKRRLYLGTWDGGWSSFWRFLGV